MYLAISRLFMHIQQFQNYYTHLVVLKVLQIQQFQNLHIQHFQIYGYLPRSCYTNLYLTPKLLYCCMVITIYYLCLFETTLLLVQSNLFFALYMDSFLTILDLNRCTHNDCLNVYFLILTNVARISGTLYFSFIFYRFRFIV